MMRKILVSILVLMIFQFFNAQEFTKQRLNNEKKLESYLSKNNISQKQKDSLMSNLAGFAGKIPLFYQSEDTGANASSNIDELQTGLVGGINVTGENIKITLFEEGRVHDTHEQLVSRAVNKEAATYAKSAHTTQVNTVLIGNGTATGTFTQSGVTYDKAKAKGVLPAGTTDNYKFATTDLGNNYEKLESLPNLNISNHSYGINLGWYYLSAASPPFYPTIGWYWVGNYELNALDTYSGTYADQDYDFDKIVYSQPNQIIVKSTGNYYGLQPAAGDKKYKWDSSLNQYVEFEATDTIPAANCSLGYNCIGYGSLAKNIITVGAVNQLPADHKYTDPSDVVKGSFSSAGPRKDGAVKPDLAAVGVDMIMGNYVSNTSNNNYINTFGTSFAAPIVSGIAGALTEIQRNILGNNNFIFRADEMKALLTHTANEAGNPGPDVWYGWGLVDAKKAARVLVNQLTEDAVFEKDTLQSGIAFTKEIKATATEPLKVSISWIDPAITPFTDDIDMQQNHTSRIVNDLDLRVINISTNEVYFPWKLDVNDPNANATKGDNTVDNVEQVVVDNPIADGIYKIEITNKNPLVDQDGNAANQDFALVVTGNKKISLTTDDSVKEQIRIYPTPTKDFINIEIPNNDAERIAVFDINGNLILESKTPKSQKISLAKFPNSVYIVTVKTKSGVSSKKIIKE